MVRLSEETDEIVFRWRVGDGEKVQVVEQARSGGNEWRNGILFGSPEFVFVFLVCRGFLAVVM